MSVWRHQLLGAFLVLATAALALLQPIPAMATPTAGQVAADRTQLDRSLSRLAASKARVAAVQARLSAASEKLDAIVQREEDLQSRLSSRVSGMYRRGETPFLAVLMNARTYEDFASAWSLLGRVNRSDAELLRELAATRRSAARSATKLIALQTQAARQLESQRREVARARQELASSAAALAEYQQSAKSAPRVGAKRPSSSAKTKDSTQKATGSGAWSKGVASHYGRNFSGRGASGARIGPYSMIVAHKTLPFGTLVEFRYNGKRAVARVADRGPYTRGRMFDLGPGVIRVLGFSGVHTVQYRVIGR